MATRKRNRAAKKPETAAKKPETASKKPETAGKKPETAALEKAKELFTLLQNMIASPVTLSTNEAAEFQRIFTGLITSANSITKLPYTGNGNGTTGAYSNGSSTDANVQYLEYKNARLKDLIIDILMKRQEDYRIEGWLERLRPVRI